MTTSLVNQNMFSANEFKGYAKKLKKAVGAKRAKMTYPETEIQRSIIKEVRLRYPKSLIYSVPNEAKRSVVMASIMKANGMVSGVADLHFIHKGKIHFIEVKSEKGAQTANQKEFERIVTINGFKYIVVRSVDEVMNFIQMSENPFAFRLGVVHK